MKSNEFIIESLEEETLDEFSTTDSGIRTALEKQGYKFLGKGVDQSAYSEPGTGKVLKIFGTQSNTRGTGGETLSTDQKMFVTYAKYCMQNANNPYLPKFDGFERFVFNDHTYFQIRMEHLSDSGDLGYAVWDIERMVKRIGAKTSQVFSQEEKDSWKLLVKKLGIDGTKLLMKTIIHLHAAGKKKGYGFDLHNENVMVRGDGTPVIVDPWVIW